MQRLVHLRREDGDYYDYQLFLFFLFWWSLWIDQVDCANSSLYGWEVVGWVILVDHFGWEVCGAKFWWKGLGPFFQFEKNEFALAQQIYGKSLKLGVWAVSLIFLHGLFVIDKHQIMFISLFPAPLDHFHFPPTLGLKWNH